ncbi:MAG: AmmeMemoRadiSam system radical SAM enzyme, partial [Candidatus Cloacimonetes bacterium]|nr:AmmeMemoRadiSam system radical SAM enzyme [Candidatus Cloacimonadota bacterium]
MDVQCKLCPHECIITEGGSGICRVRQNIEGKLFATSFGKTVTLNIDPIEKKPLYHMLPGQPILSVGHNSCNLSCDFCQNYSISQFETQAFRLSPQNLLKECRPRGVELVAFTYTEPITWFEYVLESAAFLRKNSIRTVMVTNGYIQQEPLLELLPYINAMNIDLKAWSDDFYHNICGASLAPVIETIETAAKHCHIEVTTLVIPGKNDKDIKALSEFLGNINHQIPLHLSRYYPQYKRSTPPTPLSLLEKAQSTAFNYLKHVYIGNIQTETGTNTYCPDCGSLLIERSGYQTRI